jgi:integrase
VSVRKDSRGRYCVDFTAARRRIFRRCPPGATKAQAVAYEAKLRADMWREKLNGKRPAVSLAACLQHHIERSIKGTPSEGKAEVSVYRLAPYAEGKTIDQAYECAQEFIKAARAHYAVATINLSLAALRRACSLAFEAGWTEHYIGKRIRLLPGAVRRQVWCTPAEVGELVAAAKYQRTKDLIVLLAYTGLRLGELVRLRREDVRAGVIYARSGKARQAGGESVRLIPVHPAIRAAVRRLPLEGAPRNLQAAFNWARKKAGLERVRVHDLRHTFGSWLAQQGVEGHTISELMGHKAAATTARYTHLNVEAKRRAVGRLK